jgi:tetratricopeptide (TPR) repeat protein
MLTRLGLAHYKGDKNELAVEQLNKAFVIAGNVSDKMTQMRVLSYLASIYADMEQFEDSITVAKQALAFANELEDHRLVAEQQVLLAFNYRDLGQMDEAIQYCTAALTSYEAVEDETMMEQAQALLGELESLNRN